MIRCMSSFEAICTVIDSVEVVTFDIFDTLIGRSYVIEPEDNFYLLARSKGRTDDEAQSFRKLRVAAESLARQESLRARKTAEITIYDIYAKLGDVGIRIEDEIDFERRSFYPRCLQQQLYLYAKHKGKKLYAISDIYYPKQMLKDMLSEHGYVFDDIYSSCDHARGKYEGLLFEKFLNDIAINPSLILHVGDNVHSDVVSSADYGMKSVHIPKAIDMLFRDSSINLGSVEILHKSNSYFAKFLLADMAKKTDLQSEASMAGVFASMYAAPLIFNFVNHLALEIKKDKVKKLYLMARDGYTTGAAIDAMAADIEYEIINCSRRSVMLPAAALDKKYWWTFFESAEGIPIPEIIDGLDLDCGDIIKSLYEEKFSAGVLKAGELDKFIAMSYELARPQMEEELDGAKKYFHSLGLYDDNVALVDVGWSLNSHKAIEKIMGKKIAGYYVGTSASAYQNGMIKAFLFEHEDSLAWSKIFHGAVELLELPFISLERQTVRYKNVTPLLREGAALEVSRALFAQEMRQELLRVVGIAASLHVNEKSPQTVARSWLCSLYGCLASGHHLNERILIGMIPHDRHISAVSYSTIGDFWGGGDYRLVQTSIARKVLRSVRNEGVKVTTLKVINHLSRMMR